MSKATIVMIMLAALGLGWLVGAGLADKQDNEPVSTTPGTAATESAAPLSTGGAPVYRYLSPENVTVEMDDFGSALPSAVGENFVGREGEFKTETVIINLAMDGSTEYKAIMKQGDAVVFHWKTNRGNVYYDYHGHDAAFGDEFFTRYDEGEGSERSGSMVAPYDGQHGWYFLNIEEGPTTITLNVSGFFDEIIEIELGGY